ncbi:MAG: outer membrane lipoprotein carrier protein LolA [Candidatus Scalinduaceae bacterium]
MQFKTFTLSVFLITILSFGCATHKTKPLVRNELIHKSEIDISKIKDLSFLQVKENLVLEGRKLTTLKAKADITIITPERNGTFRCKGVLRFQRPNKIRIIGSKLAITAFDMVSDGESFWFHLPKQKVVYTGKSNMTRKTHNNAYMFPDDIAVLLDYDKLFEGKPAFMETWPTFWFIHVFDKEGGEFTPFSRLKVDRTDNTVTELTLFNTDSSIKAHAFFNDYTKIDSQIIPRFVQIDWPETNTTLSLNLNNLSINETLKQEIFQFKRPRKTDIIIIN